MIVILTALDIECAAVRVHLSGLRAHHHAAGTVFEVGQLRAQPSSTVALAAIGAGTVNAAAITEQAITEFHPSVVMFVGIAGGLREWTKLGDIVVATRVYAYHGGRVDDDAFLARPRAWDTAHRLVQLAKQVNRSRAWPDASDNSPAVHFEPIAAGEVVLNSLSSPEAERLRSHYNDAVAIEMESSGVALAGHLHEATPTIAIRAISDPADGSKQNADNDGWRALAARNAAAFAVGLIAAIDESLGGTETRPSHQQDGSSAAMPAASRETPVVPTQDPQPYLHNVGGTQIGSIRAAGPVKINQSIKNYARRNPIPFALIVTVLAGLLGWGGYGVVSAVSDPDTSTAQGAAELLIEAINDRNGAALIAMACPGAKLDAEVRKVPGFENGATTSGLKASLKEVRDFGRTASVTITFHVDGQSEDRMIVLDKVNSEWCITPRS